MAYNPYLYMPYYSAIPTPTYQQVNWMPTNQAQPVNGLVSVTGLEGAKAYQLPPNSAMPLFDKDSDVLYLKSTDSAGYPTVKAFAFQPMELADAKPATADYVPRSEFDALAAKVDKLAGSRRTAKAAADGE